MKKIEIAEQFLSQNINLFKCPNCGMPFQNINNHSVTCPNNHSLDISKKGTLYFINHKINTEYNTDMLVSRRNIIRAGLFDGILNKISSLIPSGKQNILDIGSGEGTPLSKVESIRNNQDTAIGFDISKPGVNLSTSEINSNLFYCVADLANLPFNDDSISIIMDLFSPSSYNEFNRIIKNNGHLIKIVPNSGYLLELRKKLYSDNDQKQNYDNFNVINLFMEHYPNSVTHQVKYKFKIPQGMQKDLMLMTPMHWGKDAKDLTKSQLNELTSITVDVTVLDNKFTK
ncbi:methyltransferase domain-containing protein [Apilactobacillus apisilvae]|uniref:Methyltransferase domain-containing protein n=1 Tax=Apilactobacillus apisilvae TaxID=2923364 RepID=A0ABY4PJ86_9LACO|nr:methyltransferase domain-containing protein [Apilactobacillus apisilvae]UQS85554.1 methyltransferase domain-containing protein [Apilactobacillus apisilvae]